MSMIQKNKNAKWFIFAFLVLAAIYVLLPIVVVLMNSFKGRLFISTEPFRLPSTNPDNPTFVGLANYVTGITKIKFFRAFGQLAKITRVYPRVIFVVLG